MFTIILTVVCAVFVIGYIFFAAAAEQDTGPAATGEEYYTEQDAA